MRQRWTLCLRRQIRQDSRREVRQRCRCGFKDVPGWLGESSLRRTMVPVLYFVFSAGSAGLQCVERWQDRLGGRLPQRAPFRLHQLRELRSELDNSSLLVLRYRPLQPGHIRDRSVTMTDPAFPGDILIRGSSHIGFLCENGRVIQAEDHATGVHEDELYASARWTGRRRLPASMIV
jgi:hypothetical protein